MAENESSNDVDEKIEKRSCRSEDVRLTLKILASHKYFCAKRILGRGTYGDVFLMYDPARNSNVAVKIITSENIAKIELEMWPKLRHPNIVSVLEVMTLQPLDVAIFVMPVQRKSLHDIMYEKRFLCRNDSLDYLKVWLFQTLCALDYLDSRELCHLDIKVDNVLISNEYTAKLCDFSFLNYNSKCLERYDLGLPYIYRPPEACQCLGNSISIDGRAYDMWGFGIMVVEIFTHFVLATNVPDCKNWIKEVYPKLFGILQEKEFSNLMIQTFPGYNMSQTQTKLALNFAHSFLMLEPHERSVALEASQHKFLNRGMILSPLSDQIWTYEVYSESVKLPSVKSWIKKSPYFDDGKIDESEDRKELDEPSPTTDDEYLTTSDSEDEIKHSNSINEYMNTLSEEDQSSAESSEMEQSNSNESLIESNFFQKNSEFDFSQMGDVSVIKKDEKNMWLLKSKQKISVLSNDVEQNGDKKANKKYSIPMSDSKTIPRRLKKKHMINNKSRLHHNLMKSKTLCLRYEVYMNRCSDRPLKNIPKSEYFLGKLLEQKVSKVGSNGKKTFYKLSKKKIISNTENYSGSLELSSLSSGSLFSGFAEINTVAGNLKPNKSLENVKADEPMTEISTFKNANEETQFNEKCSKGATGDMYFSDYRNLVDFCCTDNSSTKCNEISSLNPELTISRLEESDQSDEVNDASHIIASVKKTLGQLNQINDILQKVLICENCNSKRKMVEEGKAENGDVTEIRPDCKPFEFLEDSREIDNDHDDAANIRPSINACCHEINCKNSILPLYGVNSQNVNLIINCQAIQKGTHQQETSNGGEAEGSPEMCENLRSLKHRRDWRKWVRNKCLQIERVVKCWKSYKILK